MICFTILQSFLSSRAFLLVQSEQLCVNAFMVRQTVPVISHCEHDRSLKQTQLETQSILLNEFINSVYSSMYENLCYVKFLCILSVSVSSVYTLKLSKCISASILFSL